MTGYAAPMRAALWNYSRMQKKNPTVDTDRNRKQHTPETNIEKKKKPKLKKTQMLF